MNARTRKIWPKLVINRNDSIKTSNLVSLMSFQSNPSIYLRCTCNWLELIQITFVWTVLKQTHKYQFIFSSNFIILLYCELWHLSSNCHKIHPNYFHFSVIICINCDSLHLVMLTPCCQHDGSVIWIIYILPSQQVNVLLTIVLFLKHIECLQPIDDV